MLAISLVAISRADAARSSLRDRGAPFSYPIGSPPYPFG
jgi:hypothetical protein